MGERNKRQSVCLSAFEQTLTSILRLIRFCGHIPKLERNSQTDQGRRTQSKRPAQVG
jgi:hypothetical protein